MNFLAHCLLSFDRPDVLLGNFMGDFIRGREWEAYPPGIQQGILLHRSIDTFTDTHECVHRGKARLRPWAGRYAGPTLDVMYDYLLALNWQLYSTEKLADFSSRTYDLLVDRRLELPEPLRSRLPMMVKAGFLDEFADNAGMRKVLARYSRRVPLPENGLLLLEAFENDRHLYELEFNAFFPELKQHAAARLDKEG